MRYSTFIIAVLPMSVALAAVMPAQAQTPPAAADDSAIGKQIATSGAPNGVAACASCHGAQGEGNPASNFPRIAGQGEGYLARQLMAYASGDRVNPIMTPIGKALSQQQIDAVARYYSALEAPSPPKPAATAADKAQTRGRTLANVGDDSIGVQGCANCHGPGGIGEPPNYPYLASQFNGYLTVTLGEWKKGTRKTDPSQLMNVIARRLSDADIMAVSAYYAAQPAPRAAAKRANVAAGSVLRPAAPGGGPTVQQSVPAQGVGIEQGAPTTGGGQGPGGGGGASGTGPQGAPRKDGQ
jgi:cytochrome c553